MRSHPFDDLVVVDITANEELAACYEDFASYGFHVISANKIAGSASSLRYRATRDAFLKQDATGYIMRQLVRDYLLIIRYVIYVKAVIRFYLSVVFSPAHYHGYFTI